mgnify:CR=1 FL=1
MKTTIISKSLLAVALTLTMASFTSDKKESSAEAAKRDGFGASIFQVAHSSKVKLAVNTADESRLRVTLRDTRGKIYYDESNKTNQYRRTFDLADMSDGTYYFEIAHKDHTLKKELKLQTTPDKAITFQ